MWVLYFFLWGSFVRRSSTRRDVYLFAATSFVCMMCVVMHLLMMNCVRCPIVGRALNWEISGF